VDSTPFENTDDDGTITHESGYDTTTDVVSHYPKWPETDGSPREVSMRKPRP
jgi:hypothetical protein